MKVSAFILSILFMHTFSATVAASPRPDDYHQVVKQYVDNHAFNGVVLVAEKGRVVFHQGFGIANADWDIAHTTQSKFKLASLSKSMTAMLVMQLIEAGKLNLGDTLDVYLPYLPKDKTKRITIESLLAHRSGLPRQFAIPGWTQGKFARLSDKKAYAQEIGKLDLLAEPGKEYGYTNLGYFLLALVVEQVTGTAFEQALSQYIFKPLGMKDTGAVSNNGIVKQLAQSFQISPQGGYRQAPYINMNLFFGGAGLYATALDVLKFEQALYGPVLLDDKHRKIYMNKTNPFNWYFEPWQVGQNGSAVETMHWGGELPGVSSFLVRFIDDNNTIIILSNDGLNEVEKRRMARQLAAVLYQGEYKPEKLPLSLVLTKALYEDSLQQTIDRVKNQKHSYLIDNSIEQMGLQLMWTGELSDAVSLLALNVYYFPDSPSAHENLSQALEANQLWQMALKSKQQALRLLPDNAYLKEEVARLKSKLDRG